MNTLEQLLFGMSNVPPSQLMIRTALLLIAALALVWAIQRLLLMRSRKQLPHRDFLLPEVLLTSLIVVALLLATYWFFVLRQNAMEAFRWQEPAFYLNLAPILIVVLGSIAWFVMLHNRYVKSLKNANHA